ncbi:zf-HC2 domain-containing protein [Nocardioides sp. B-3]|uniref:zf-HC2 domain-containing protein n=1 Tax=Nocardioides sp. B-3 TaxID=2895565 RepID=UPI0021534D43|nr:anti-sigma factor [Nocardioides sp. B-3]UUZ60158.1 zf-HC2 domain-containing protein [Nocardioides sp. B-3]
MHLGSRVSALLDGRLPAAEEERARAHVHECNPCRDLVEREGWIKTGLAGLSLADRSECEAPDRLKNSLLGCGSALTPPAFPTAATTIRARHRSPVAIGGGAAGAAVVGVLALGAAGTPQLERRAPISDLTRPSQTSTPVVNDHPATRRTPKRQRRVTPPRVFTPEVVAVRDALRVTMAP